MSIEKALLDFGKPTYEKVVEMVNKRYHCGLTDCYEHPEYLKRILQDLYGKSSITIIESIKKQLEEFLDREPIGKFVEVISQ